MLQPWILNWMWKKATAIDRIIRKILGISSRILEIILNAPSVTLSLLDSLRHVVCTLDRLSPYNFFYRFLWKSESQNPRTFFHVCRILCNSICLLHVMLIFLTEERLKQEENDAVCRCWNEKWVWRWNNKNFSLE